MPALSPGARLGAYEVIDLVDGETLADRLSRGPMAVDGALRVARQMAEALEAAHEKGIVHRDLKPANVKISADEKVKVLDFGLVMRDGQHLLAIPFSGIQLRANASPQFQVVLNWIEELKQRVPR
jgi:serine/threonine protein kinase